MVEGTVIELRPRGVMELFDQAIRLYRNNFLQFVGIIAVAEVPIQVVQMLLNILVYRGETDSSYLPAQALGSSFVGLVIAIFSFIFVSGLATAALTRAITDSYLGDKISIGGAYQKIQGNWTTLLGAMFTVGLLVILLLIWTLIPCIGWLTGFGMVFFLSVVVAPLIAPIIVIENLDSSTAIRRAWEMARRRFWWLTGFFLLLMLFNFLVVQGPVQIVTQVIQSYFLQGASSANLASTAALQAISTSLVTLILSLLYIPLASTCATLAYFNLRVRQEGFDLALMANQLDESPAHVMDLASRTPTVPEGPLMTWIEMGYFALFSFIAAAIYAVAIGFVMILGMIVMASSGL